MSSLWDYMAQVRDLFLSADHSHIMSVNDLWVSFKSEFIAAIEIFIPSKMTKTKNGLSWIKKMIRHFLRKHECLYKHAQKSSSPDIMNYFKRFRAHV